jgi:hypothetical protein
MPPLADTSIISPMSVDECGDHDNTQYSGYIEVKAIEDPKSGSIKDEIMIVLPDMNYDNDNGDSEDPLYYYPKAGASTVQDDEDDDDDSDDEAQDRFVVNNNLRSRQLLAAGGEEKSDAGEMEYSFMEELAQTLDSIFGCNYSGCADSVARPVLKSILRRKGSSDNIPPIDRNVSFTKLEIREFNMTLGNHPSAVTVSWFHSESSLVCALQLI